MPYKMIATVLAPDPRGDPVMERVIFDARIGEIRRGVNTLEIYMGVPRQIGYVARDLDEVKKGNGIVGFVLGELKIWTSGQYGVYVPTE